MLSLSPSFTFRVGFSFNDYSTRNGPLAQARATATKSARVPVARLPGRSSEPEGSDSAVSPCRPVPAAGPSIQHCHTRAAPAPGDDRNERLAPQLDSDACIIPGPTEAPLSPSPSNAASGPDPPGWPGPGRARNLGPARA
jgi:hypothetical protein